MSILRSEGLIIYNSVQYHWRPIRPICCSASWAPQRLLVVVIMTSCCGKSGDDDRLPLVLYFTLTTGRMCALKCEDPPKSCTLVTPKKYLQ